MRSWNSLVVLLFAFVVLFSFTAGPAAAQDTFESFRFDGFTGLQTGFTAAGVATALAFDNERLVPWVIGGAFAYEFLREDKADNPFEAGAINAGLYFGSYILTRTVQSWLFGLRE